jgi:hypothetical protein
MIRRTDYSKSSHGCNTLHSFHHLSSRCWRWVSTSTWCIRTEAGRRQDVQTEEPGLQMSGTSARPPLLSKCISEWGRRVPATSRHSWSRSRQGDKRVGLREWTSIVQLRGSLPYARGHAKLQALCQSHKVRQKLQFRFSKSGLCTSQQRRRLGAAG